MWSGIGTPKAETEGRSCSCSYATQHKVITAYRLPDKGCLAFISHCFKYQVDRKLFIVPHRLSTINYNIPVYLLKSYVIETLVVYKGLNKGHRTHRFNLSLARPSHIQDQQVLKYWLYFLTNILIIIYPWPSFRTVPYSSTGHLASHCDRSGIVQC